MYISPANDYKPAALCNQVTISNNLAKIAHLGSAFKNTFPMALFVKRRPHTAKDPCIIHVKKPFLIENYVIPWAHPKSNVYGNEDI